MSQVHRVVQGQSLVNLAHRYGLPAERILNHPDNRDLFTGSRSQTTLYPGDRLTIPDRETGEIAAATEQRHRFRRQSSTWLRLRLLDENEPRADVPYWLVIDEREYTGQLDGDGRLELQIPARAQRGLLYLGENRDEEMEILIHHLDPMDHDSGVQKRLNNLGYDCGLEDGDIGPRSRAALKQFQADCDLEPTGQLDDRTREQLEQAHGC
jgi:N-acetylmuramoyl-L-alanine amidase